MTAHYVYRCYDSTGLAYVGSTRNVFGRIQNHAASSWWAPTIIKVEATVFRGKSEATAAERDAIRTEHPRWNIMGRWSTRVHWNEQQWRDYYRAICSVRGSEGSAVRLRHVEAVASYFAHLYGRPITQDAA